MLGTSEDGLRRWISVALEIFLSERATGEFIQREQRAGRNYDEPGSPTGPVFSPLAPGSLARQRLARLIHHHRNYDEQQPTSSRLSACRTYPHAEERKNERKPRPAIHRYARWQRQLPIPKRTNFTGKEGRSGLLPISTNTKAAQQLLLLCPLLVATTK